MIINKRTIKTCKDDNYDATLKQIMVSKQIRRLKGKKQVFSLVLPPNNVKYDYVHERLLHTLEVESISLEIIKKICERNFIFFQTTDSKKQYVNSKITYSQSLLDCIAFSHDFGHTPFGHIGEIALTDYLDGTNNVLSEKKSTKASNDSSPYFKHNYYSAALLFRKFHSCSPDIIDGVLKHTSTNKISGRPTVVDLNRFGSNSFLPGALRKPGYLEKQFAYTLEGQVVAIADEIAQILSDIEDSEIVFLKSFARIGDLSPAKKQERETLKQYLKRLRNIFISDVVDTSVQNIKEYLSTKVTIEDILFFDKKVVDFSASASQMFKEIEISRTDSLHGDNLVQTQNFISYLIIFRVFDYYLKNIKNLFDHDQKSKDYISENFCRIRNDSKTKKDKTTRLTKYDSFVLFMQSQKQTKIIEEFNNIIVPNGFTGCVITPSRTSELEHFCKYLIQYYFNNYGEEQLLDNLCRSLLREISFSIAKMTDRYAVELFYKTFGKHFRYVRALRFVKKCKHHTIKCDAFSKKSITNSLIRQSLKKLKKI